MKGFTPSGLVALVSTALAWPLTALAAPTAPTTIEAEAMSYKSVGGGYDGIWNIWENGSISNDVPRPDCAAPAAGW